MRLLRSRVVLSMTAPPLEDGAVLVSGDRIASIGPWQSLRNDQPGADLTDLGDAILLPGFVNAHCHLEYTHFAGHLPPPKRFTDWLQGVLGLKAGWSFSEFADSWLAGARQLLRTGCTSVMDFAAVPELLPEVWLETPLRVLSALELTGVRSGRTPEEVLAEASAHLERLRPTPPGKALAIAPHATYSTRPGLLELSAEEARRHAWPLACHVAESRDEFDMFTFAEGPMYQWLRGQRDMTDCGRQTPVRHVASHGLLGENTILVHANYLGPGDESVISGSGSSVVHCPRSHEYFGHAPFPFARLRSAGVRVGLGTDSLLSVLKGGLPRPELSMLEEMKTFSALHPGVAPREILEMATVIAARIIGSAGQVGVLWPGALADLIAIPYSGPRLNAEAAVVAHQGDVAGVMIGGQWVWCGNGSVDPADSTWSSRETPRTTP